MEFSHNKHANFKVPNKRNNAPDCLAAEYGKADISDSGCMMTPGSATYLRVLLLFFLFYLLDHILALRLCLIKTSTTKGLRKNHGAIKLAIGLSNKYVYFT